jgi:hypothetical protein
MNGFKNKSDFDQLYYEESAKPSSNLVEYKFYFRNLEDPKAAKATLKIQETGQFVLDYHRKNSL